MGLKVPEWDGKAFDPGTFYIAYRAHITHAIVTTIHPERDEHRLLSCIDAQHAQYCTSNPMAKRQ